MAPTLGYWDIRGLGHALRMLLHYKEVEFEDKRYTEGPAPDFSKDDWLKDKFNLGLDLPNLPYYIDGETKITETSAILAHLGRKYELCGSTEEAKVRNDMTYSYCWSQRMAFAPMCYNKDFEKLKGPYLESLPGRLESISRWLGDHPYFGGAEIVSADFCMYDVLDTLRVFSPGCLDKHENLTAYMSRIESLPTLKKVMESDLRMSRGPFTGAMALWRG